MRRFVVTDLSGVNRSIAHLKVARHLFVCAAQFAFLLCLRICIGARSRFVVRWIEHKSNIRHRQVKHSKNVFGSESCAAGFF